MTIKLERIHSFNSLRVISCALVFVSHGLFHTPIFGSFENHFHGGQLGVDIFFVLSGFLITRILLADKANGSPWHYFVARRSFRILPAWLLLLVTMSLLLPWLRSVRPDTWTGPMHWSVWTYTFNYATAIWPLERVAGARLDHLWTLCVEEHYYLLWPVAVYALTRQQSRRVLLTVVPAVTAFSVYYYVQRANTWGLQTTTNVRGISLAIGSLMAYHEGWCRSPAARLTAGAAILVGILLAANPSTVISIPVLVMDIVLSAGITLLFLTTVEPLTATPQFSWMRNRLIEVIGTMTYGLYLFHLPTFQWFRVDSTGVRNSFEALIVVFAVAIVSYNVVERPFIAFGTRFRVSGRVVPASWQACVIESGRQKCDGLETPRSTHPIDVGGSGRSASIATSMQ